MVETCLHLKRDRVARSTSGAWTLSETLLNIVSRSNIWWVSATTDVSVYLLCRQAGVFLKRGPHRIGSTYKKAVYTQYTNHLYDVEVDKPSWLGFLGPIIKGEVGDSIIVHLKNFASRNYTLHPHGVGYTKNNEGKFESFCAGICQTLIIPLSISNILSSKTRPIK